MTGFTTLIKRVHYLNIDSIGCAAASVWSASRITDVSVPKIWWGVICLSVWVVYTVDRLLESRLANSQAMPDRYRWHRNHALLLWIGVLVGIAIIGALLPALSKNMILAIGLAGMWVGLHIYLSRFRWYSGIKEMQLSAIYTAGVWGACITGFLDGQSLRMLTSWHASFFVWAHAGLFFLVVMLNQATLNSVEYAQDQLLPGASLSTRISQSTINGYSYGVGVGITIMAIYLNTRLAYAWAVMAWLHCAVCFLAGRKKAEKDKEKNSESTLQRTFLETVFLMQFIA